MRQRFGMATNVNLLSSIPPLPSYALAWTETGSYPGAGRLAREPHPFHTVVVHLSPAGLVARRCDGLSHISAREEAAREIDLVPAGLASEWDWTAPCSSVLLHLSPSLLGEEDDERPVLAAALGETDPQIRSLALAIHQNQAPHRDSGLIEAVARRLGERYARRAARIPAERLARVFAYIRENLDGDLSLETLARLARMSPFYFVRQFKQATGWTPHQYVIRTRVERARELLGARQANLCDIAYTCGFSSQSHFTNLFRREVGATPQVFRRQLSMAVADPA